MRVGYRVGLENPTCTFFHRYFFNSHRPLKSNTTPSASSSILCSSCESPARAGADFAARVDHAVPGHVAVRREGVQGVADLAGVAFQAGELGDLSVRRDPAARDAAHHRLDPFVLHGEVMLGLHTPLGSNVRNNRGQ